MDELTQWQLEQMAKRAREQHERIEDSGALEIARFTSQLVSASDVTAQMHSIADAFALYQMRPDVIRDAIRALADPLPPIELDAVLAEAARAVEIIQAFENSIAGIALYIQATNAQMVASLAGVHRILAGVGATFTVTLNQDVVDTSAFHESQVELPAGMVEESTLDAINLSNSASAEVIRGILSLTKTGGTSGGLGQISELEMSTATASGHPLGFVNSQQHWSIQYSEESDDVHSFIFKGYGERARTMIDWLRTTTRAMINGDDPSKHLSLLPKTTDVLKGTIENEEKTTNELQKTLLAMGYPADQVERAIEECRNEQQVLQGTRIDDKTGEMQYLEGAFIEPTTELFPGVIRQERDGIVTNKLLAEQNRLLADLLTRLGPPVVIETAIVKWQPNSSDGSQQVRYRPTEQLSDNPTVRGKSGKPTFPENLWAYEQVNKLRRPRKEVYGEWMVKRREREKKAGIEDKLVDPRDSFNKVVRKKREELE